MMKLFAVFLAIFTMGQAFACPMCAGSNNGNDQYLVYILMGFILLTYIPFYFIYRTIIKNRNPNIPAESEANN